MPESRINSLRHFLALAGLAVFLAGCEEAMIFNAEVRTAATPSGTVLLVARTQPGAEDETFLLYRSCGTNLRYWTALPLRETPAGAPGGYDISGKAAALFHDGGRLWAPMHEGVSTYRMEPDSVADWRTAPLPEGFEPTAGLAMGGRAQLFGIKGGRLAASFCDGAPSREPEAGPEVERGARNFRAVLWREKAYVFWRVDDRGGIYWAVFDGKRWGGGAGFFDAPPGQMDAAAAEDAILVAVQRNPSRHPEPAAIARFDGEKTDGFRDFVDSGKGSARFYRGVALGANGRNMYLVRSSGSYIEVYGRSAMGCWDRVATISGPGGPAGAQIVVWGATLAAAMILLGTWLLLRRGGSVRA